MDKEISKKFQAHLATQTDQELVEIFNKGVGLTVWSWPRSAFVNELRKAFDVRDIDLSAVTNKSGGLNFNKKIELVEKTVKTL